MKTWVVCLVLIGFAGVTISSSLQMVKQSNQEKSKPAQKKSKPQHDLRTVIG